MNNIRTKLGLVFSARKGNCLDFARYILDPNEVLHIADYKISPCSGCEYECFHQTPCPIQDDLHQIYDHFSKAEKILIVSPVYDSRPPALYYAFQERLPSIWNREANGFNLFKGKKIALIVIGNEGIQGAFNILRDNCQGFGMTILSGIKIIPKTYAKGGGITGGLIENIEIRHQLDEIKAKMY